MDPSANCPSTIMTPICSLVQTGTHDNLGLPSSSIFFLPAECNLYQYITNTKNLPRTDTARLRNFQRMLGICRGLGWLHQNLVYEGASDKFELASYYHCELAPDNILMCYQRTAAGDDRVFKISDFGQAQGLRQKPDMLSSNWRPWRRSQESGRSGPTFSSPPRTSEGTYLAPEARDGASSKSDVWLFGCILLMVMVFNYEDAPTVKQFRDQRLKHCELASPNRKNDQFYVLQGDKAVINPATEKHIFGLMDRTKDTHNGNSDTNLTESALKYLQIHVFVTKLQKQDSMEEVSETLRKYYNDRPAIHVRAVLLADIQDNIEFYRNFTDGRAFTYSTNMLKFYEHERQDHIARLRHPIGDQWCDLINSRSKFCVATESLHRMQAKHGWVNSQSRSLVFHSARNH